MPPKRPARRLASLASFISVGVARGAFPDYPMTINEMEVVAGYYTKSGKYRGGIPDPDDVSKEIYDCVDDNFFYPAANDTYNNATATTLAGNATACMEWRANEAAEGTFQLGTCECRAVENEAYCSAWTCIQGDEKESCDEEDCYMTTLCECDVENNSGLYCDSWSCKQTDSDGREEFEEYHCQRESSSGHFCEAWNGNVTAHDEIEVVRCECVAMWNGDRVCSYWECEEIGLVTCASSAASGCNLIVSVGVGGVFGFLGIITICAGVVSYADSQGDGFCWICLGITWCSLWSIGVVIWGGVDGATIVGILWGTGLLLLIALACCISSLDRV